MSHFYQKISFYSREILQYIARTCLRNGLEMAELITSSNNVLVLEIIFFSIWRWVPTHGFTVLYREDTGSDHLEKETEACNMFVDYFQRTQVSVSRSNCGIIMKMMDQGQIML